MNLAQQCYTTSTACLFLSMYTAIVACDIKWGIAKANCIPWRNTVLGEVDHQHFQRIVAGRIAIYGAGTLAAMRGCLPMCATNIIVSEKLTPDKIKARGAKFAIARDMENAVQLAERAVLAHKTTAVILGGSAIYEWFDKNNLLSSWVVSNIPGDYQCDKHVVIDPERYTLHSEELVGQIDKLRVTMHTCRNPEESAMLSILAELYEQAVDPHVQPRNTRAAPCYAVFGRQLRFDLSDGRFPLMTTRKMFFRGIFEELMFVLRGQTDTNILEALGVNVWRANTRRAALDKLGLYDLPEGDMGHSYGHSMRHFGAQYNTCRTDYTGKGFDQLAHVIDLLRDDPMSRRAVISLWEPNHEHRAALPPCMFMYQFFVSRANNRKSTLSCVVTQRSSDFVLAGGWNIASAALFTILLASFLSLQPSELIWNVGDCHLYANNSLDLVAEQLSRAPHSWPRLTVLCKPTEMTAWQFDYISLQNYAPHGSLRFEMNA